MARNTGASSFPSAVCRSTPRMRRSSSVDADQRGGGSSVGPTGFGAQHHVIGRSTPRFALQSKAGLIWKLSPAQES